MKTYIHLRQYLTEVFLKLENFQMEFVDIVETHICVQ